jgi:hypothetical protein
MSTSVLFLFHPGHRAGALPAVSDGVWPGQTKWGGWDSNPGPADYESAALTG